MLNNLGRAYDHLRKLLFSSFKKEKENFFSLLLRKKSKRKKTSFLFLKEIAKD